jgi:hypothetical protein
MNFVSLIVHGLGAMSVFSDIVFTRILFASLISLVAVAPGLCSIVGIRLFTDLAVPGWATNIFGISMWWTQRGHANCDDGIPAVEQSFIFAKAPREFAMDFVRENRDLIRDMIVDSLPEKVNK